MKNIFFFGKKLLYVITYVTLYFISNKNYDNYYENLNIKYKLSFYLETLKIVEFF